MCVLKSRVCPVVALSFCPFLSGLVEREVEGRRGLLEEGGVEVEGVRREGGVCGGHLGVKLPRGRRELHRRPAVQPPGAVGRGRRVVSRSRGVV